MQANNKPSLPLWAELVITLVLTTIALTTIATL